MIVDVDIIIKIVTNTDSYLFRVLRTITKRGQDLLDRRGFQKRVRLGDKRNGEGRERERERERAVDFFSFYAKRSRLQQDRSTIARSLLIPFSENPYSVASGKYYTPMSLLVIFASPSFYTHGSAIFDSERTNASASRASRYT